MGSGEESLVDGMDVRSKGMGRGRRRRQRIER